MSKQSVSELRLALSDVQALLPYSPYIEAHSSSSFDLL
jgi:hypothetical protein